MKKVIKILVLACFTTWMITFAGCKKDAENPPVTSPAITTAAVSQITPTTAVVGGNVTSAGGALVVYRGICWSTTHGPTIADNITTDGAGFGVYSSSITGLTPNTTYYVRAYATNSVGTIYGGEISFSTLAVVTTTAIEYFSSTSAQVTGNVYYGQNGGELIGSGVCWSTSRNPTTNDSKTMNSTYSGDFTSDLEGLTAGTTYFVRTYALYYNNTTFYGNELSFTTSLAQGIRKADFPGGARYAAAGFSIGTKVYMGLGYDFNDAPQNDFWEWDQATDIWTKKADYPGNSRGNTVCFSIDTKGYIGTGDGTVTNEFWEYDPSTNTWTQKASLPGTPSRQMAAGFSIGNKGYIGTGNVDNGGSGLNLNDFWEWDQVTNVWTKKSDFGGVARSGAVGFSIGTKGYIGTGWGGQGGSTLLKDFWEWDQAADTWTKKADFGGVARGLALGFSIGTKGYIGNGGNDSFFYKDYWEWDQATDTWIRKADFAGSGRIEAVCVSIGNKGYIGTGTGSGFTNDFWEYDPNLK